MRIMSQEHRSMNSLHYDYERLNSFKFEKPICESAAPVARNTIENNQVKIINYRGTKLTSFNVDGRQLICLPQAFDYFLKNLVGGLHTVYTKLKRLEILPIVCNVEQVRILRSLGAIQPGVNRCKLLAPNEFEILYDDCTSTGSRPGRPPKRNPSYQTNDYPEDKRLKFASNLFRRVYPNHLNQLSLFNSSSFIPTLPQLYSTNNNQTSTSSNESRSFTIDAMLSNTRDRLTKPIDLPMTTIEQTSSSILPTTTSMDFFHMKNMMELTVANTRLREKQLENEIVDLKNEITKEQDYKQKLRQDFLQLRRVRSILIKKLKRLNRSNTCSNNQNNLLDKSSSNTIPIASI